MRDVTHIVRPLTQEARARIADVERRQSRFGRTDGSSNWRETMDVLKREVEYLGADNFILMADVTESQIRIDGQIRADARPSSPDVAVSIEGKDGPLLFACGSFTTWRDNVRAIALGLEALRKVDRYGITASDEQYRGFRALPPARRLGTLEEAAQFILANSGQVDSPGNFMAIINGSRRRFFYTEAAKRLHPDAGGTSEAFQRLQDARRVLEAGDGS